MKTRRLKLLLPLLGAVLLFALPAAASVYKCTGSDGRLYFTDRPCPPQTKATRVEIDHATRVEPGEPAQAAATPAAAPSAPEAGEEPVLEQAEDAAPDADAENTEETEETVEETPAESSTNQ